MTNFKRVGHRAVEVPSLLIFAAMAWLIWPALWNGYLMQSRGFTDALNLTPFRDVEVFGQVLDDRGLTIAGSMVKVRCEFRSLSAYTFGPLNRANRATIDTTPEDTIRPGGNRPYLREAQLWGPWRITPSVDALPPVRWEIFAHHRCAGSPTEVVTLFAAGNWGDASE